MYISLLDPPGTETQKIALRPAESCDFMFRCLGWPSVFRGYPLNAAIFLSSAENNFIVETGDLSPLASPQMAAEKSKAKCEKSRSIKIPHAANKKTLDSAEG